jgi:hypothetical protein
VQVHVGNRVGELWGRLVGDENVSS